MEEHNDRQLELDTMEALRGTGDLKERLLLEMSTGTPAIADMAYAVKVRVKEDYKIIEKIERKRLQKSNYAVSNLRDIVGLRIITLYRLDALRIIPELLKKMRAGVGDPNSLFVSDGLEEIVIYSTNPQGDAQGLSSRLMDVFAASGLANIAKVSEAASNYTSIHMVTWCRGKYRDAYRKIPVEIQVRTALEDVWSEIDHSLKYKRTSSLKQGSMIDHAEEGRLQSSLSHLNVMKTLIDGIAQYADQIKIQLDEVDDLRLKSVSSRPAQDSVSLIADIQEIPTEIRENFQRAVRNAQQALQQPRGSGATEAERLTMQRKALVELENVSTQLSTVSLPQQAIQEASYILEMEYALLLFEIGNEVESGTNLLARAVKIYSSLEAQFPDRLIVKYRHAKALDALRDRSTAVAKLKALLQQLSENDDLLPKGHWVRSAARRVLGVLLWEEADQLRRENLSDENEARRQERLKLYLEAFQVTRPAYEIELESGAPQAGGAGVGERAKVANNLLYFALEYLQEGGDRLNLNGFELGDVDQFLKDMQAEDPAKVSELSTLDTARRAYEYLGDQNRAAAAARRLLTVHKEIGSKSVHDDDMVKAAKATLSRAETTSLAEPPR